MEIGEVLQHVTRILDEPPDRSRSDTLPEASESRRLGELQRNLHRIFNRSHRRLGESSQRRKHSVLLFKCEYLITLGPRIKPKTCLSRGNSWPQRKLRPRNACDGNYANIEREAIERISRDHNCRALFVQGKKANVAALRMPPRRLDTSFPVHQSRETAFAEAFLKARTSPRSSTGAAKKCAISESRRRLRSASSPARRSSLSRSLVERFPFEESI